ncbi:hypothetical protein L2E82_43903 [Cichorium intybus]|uniref:Uncharacterized protein n=1 Tax=Cichorium intybus TaxID=13427 RepID=A0ACB8ZNH6_CICIN|nr:hypothetical protein L2E82_43903 [Cichorium intybus]
MIDGVEVESFNSSEEDRDLKNGSLQRQSLISNSDSSKSKDPYNIYQTINNFVPIPITAAATVPVAAIATTTITTATTPVAIVTNAMTTTFILEFWLIPSPAVISSFSVDPSPTPISILTLNTPIVFVVPLTVASPPTLSSTQKVAYENITSLGNTPIHPPVYTPYCSFSRDHSRDLTQNKMNTKDSRSFSSKPIRNSISIMEILSAMIDMGPVMGLDMYSCQQDMLQLIN